MIIRGRVNHENAVSLKRRRKSTRGKFGDEFETKVGEDGGDGKSILQISSCAFLIRGSKIHAKMINFLIQSQCQESRQLKFLTQLKRSSVHLPINVSVKKMLHL